MSGADSSIVTEYPDSGDPPTAAEPGMKYVSYPGGSGLSTRPYCPSGRPLQVNELPEPAASASDRICPSGVVSSRSYPSTAPWQESPTISLGIIPGGQL